MYQFCLKGAGNKGEEEKKKGQMSSCPDSLCVSNSGSNMNFQSVFYIARYCHFTLPSCRRACAALSETIVIHERRGQMFLENDVLFIIFPNKMCHPSKQYFISLF